MPSLGLTRALLWRSSPSPRLRRLLLCNGFALPPLMSRPRPRPRPRRHVRTGSFRKPPSHSCSHLRRPQPRVVVEQAAKSQGVRGRHAAVGLHQARGHPRRVQGSEVSPLGTTRVQFAPSPWSFNLMESILPVSFEEL